MLKLFLPATLLFVFSQSIAQPTLTSTCNPINGDSMVYYNCDSVGTGAVGANVTWDYSGLVTTSNQTLHFASCPAGPGCASFPGSSLANSTTANAYHLYYITSATKLSMNGTDLPSNVVYSDPEDFLHYPFTYNDKFTDSFKATFVSASYNYLRFGTTSDTADGWGTLILPSGTFHNALRVHKVQQYKDSNTAFPFTTTYHDDLYMWYVPGIRDFVFGITQPMQINGNPTGTTVVAYRNISPSAGVNAFNFDDVNLSIFPNPAKDKLTIKLGEQFNEQIQVSLTDMLGKEIMAEGYNTKIMQQCSFNTSSLAPGLYFVCLHTSKGNITRKVEIL